MQLMRPILFPCPSCETVPLTQIMLDKKSNAK